MSTVLALFAFGTLMDPDVLRLVAEHDPETLQLEPAMVTAHARRWVQEDHYPVLVPDDKSCTQGMIIRGLSHTAMQRIEFFEGEEFTLRELLVENAQGQTERVNYFADNQRKPVSEQEWLLEHWQQSTKAEMLPRVRRYMACHGHMSAAEADAYW